MFLEFPPIEYMYTSPIHIRSDRKILSTTNKCQTSIFQQTIRKSFALSQNVSFGTFELNLNDKFMMRMTIFVLFANKIKDHQRFPSIHPILTGGIDNFGSGKIYEPVPIFDICPDSRYFIFHSSIVSSFFRSWCTN